MRWQQKVPDDTILVHHGITNLDKKYDACYDLSGYKAKYVTEERLHVCIQYDDSEKLPPHVSISANF